MILNGDVREMLDKIESNSVQTCITSPPYWNLRDYESDTQLGMEDTPQEFASSLVKIFYKVNCFIIFLIRWSSCPIKSQ